MKSGSWLWGGAEWHPLSEPVSLSNINLSDILVYAAHTYDRQHILEIDMKIDDTLKPIDSTLGLSDTDLVEEWTIDRDTAFEIGWNLTIVKKLKDLFLQQLNQQRKKEYQFTSIRFPIVEETQELVYFPVYVVDYQYRNRQLQCLINGRTGHVAGLRQFSRLKVLFLSHSFNQLSSCFVLLGNGFNSRCYLSGLSDVIRFFNFICLLCCHSSVCHRPVFPIFNRN